ncbi:MAG: HD domain-containing protein, partial [Candidatus Hydrogenedentes bacterium]|nr:HD domain-containing protein [Candidatus Hydrogenedentota bacterium]
MEFNASPGLIVPPVQARPAQYHGHTYYPIGMGSIRINSTPSFDLFLRPGPEQPFVLYCERNTPFAEEAWRRLELSRIEMLWVRQDDLHGYNLYVSDHLASILSDGAQSPAEKATILYDCAQAVVGEVLRQPRSKEALARGKQIARHTVDYMTADDFKVEPLLRSLSSEYYLYTHSVNVATYSIALAMRAGFGDQATLREIAHGALLHDIGESMIDPEILNKPGNLSGAEWEIVRAHPEAG